MAENDAFKVGAVNYPLTAATTNSLLRDADPAIYWTLEFYKSVINTYVRPRLLAEVALLQGVPITTGVLHTCHFDPGPALLEHPENLFPLLAAYRSSTVFNQVTLTWDHGESEWEIAYVLPALHWPARRKLLPVLKAVNDVILDRTRQGWDTAYASGAQVLASASYANLETIDLMRSRYGRYEDGEGLYYEALICTMRVRERVMPPADGTFADLGDVDTNLDNAQTGEVTVSNVVQTRTDTDP